MLLLPAAALCCVCSALVAMAAELKQDSLSLTRKVGEEVSFSCGGTDQCSGSYVFWYQKRDTETFRRILDISRSGGAIDKSYNHPQKDDFSAVNKQNGCELQIQKVKLSHSASYYCSCSSWYFIFGSGTRLFVTDEQVVKPVVSVYPAAPSADLEGKSSLLCVASAMFPPLVQFSWKRQKENGRLEELPSADGRLLKLRESGCTASILSIHQQEISLYEYRCYVQHEGFRVEAQTETGNEGLVTVFSNDSASFTDILYNSFPVSEGSPSQYQVKLLLLLYTLLIVKSLVYCCGLFVLTILRNK
uniref:immunoglobulin lambda-1 light chain-like n=1 Tax=Semicossyphus pulcher TaxID=241346 RepID=UPI0037E87ED6